jgi:hypothetical protein
MTPLGSLRPVFHKYQVRSFILGVIGLGAMAAGLVYTPSTGNFYSSYLFGYAFWVGLSLGCLALLMLHHLVSGAWGFVIQRIVEAGARTLPLMAVLFIPVVFGMKELYPWTHPATVGQSHELQAKSGYLSANFFVIRTVVYFGFWITASFVLSTWSRRQDKTGTGTLTARMKTFSGPGMVAFVLTGSFAAFDWMMSLEPGWYSTIYGAMVIVGNVLAALCFAVVLIRFFSLRKPLVGILTTRHYHHLGNMIMAFTILWAYLAFSQFLIIWAGNLPEENSWYLGRLGGGWGTIALLLIVGHFAVPLVLLLLRRNKRSIRRLAVVASMILVMRVIDVFWLVKPAFPADGFSVSALDVLAPLGIGGFWVGYFILQLKTESLVPLHDPRFPLLSEQAQAS